MEEIAVHQVVGRIRGEAIRYPHSKGNRLLHINISHLLGKRLQRPSINQVQCNRRNHQWAQWTYQPDYLKSILMK